MKYIKLAILLIMCSLPLSAKDNINEEILGVNFKFQSGVIYDFTYNDFGVSYGLSFLKYKNYAELKFGKIVGNDWQSYFGGLALNVKNVLNDIGGDVKYNFPIPIEISLYTGYNWEDGKFNWGIGLNVVDIKF